MIEKFKKRYKLLFKITGRKFYRPFLSGIIHNNHIEVHHNGRTCDVNLEEFNGIVKLFCYVKKIEEHSVEATNEQNCFVTKEEAQKECDKRNGKIY